MRSCCCCTRYLKYRFAENSVDELFVTTNIGTDKPPFHLPNRSLGNSPGQHFLARICVSAKLKYFWALHKLYQLKARYARFFECRSQHLELTRHVPARKSALGLLLWICGSMPQSILMAASLLYLFIRSHPIDLYIQISGTSDKQIEKQESEIHSSN